MFDFLKNAFLNRGRYKTHSDAVVVSCFFNPQNSPYRLLAFQKWYHSIKHLNHRIIECLIGDDAKSQLPQSPHITQVRADSLLFHKEALLNKAIEDLSDSFKYVFWIDADVLFTNDSWLVDSVDALQNANIVQPFEYCVHLERNQTTPDFDVEAYKPLVNDLERRHKRLWRSFAANFHDGQADSSNYDEHGHVGFAWGARRHVLEDCPLFEEALIGGADHILAHAAAGQIPHECITKSFTDNINEVLSWSKKFHAVVAGRLGYVPGDLYHIWHGDISDRKYLKRIREFTGSTTGLERDKNGFYVARGKNAEYMRRYYRQREVSTYYDDYDGFDDGFQDDMGYAIYDIAQMFGQPSYQDADAGSQTRPSVQSADPDVLMDRLDESIPDLDIEDAVPASETDAGGNFS